MTIELKKINVLPGPTWNWLNVNSSRLSFAGAAEMKARIVTPVVRSLCPNVFIAGVMPADFPKIETGMGEEAIHCVEHGKAGCDSLVISENCRVKKPIVLQYQLGDGELVLDRHYIRAKANSEATIVMNYTSPDRASGFHGGATTIYAEQGARLKLVQVQTLGQGYCCFDDIGTMAEDNAGIEVNQVELGGGKVWAGCKTSLEGDNASFRLSSSYIGHGSQTVDLNYVTVHRGTRTNSSMVTSGILMDNSAKVMRGTLDFVRGCRAAVGNESETVLLLDQGVSNKTVPLILCGEEDVEGNHAATVGEMDPAQMFYLASRGLTEREMRGMLIASRIQLICDAIPEENLKETIANYGKEVLENGLSLSE